MASNVTRDGARHPSPPLLVLAALHAAVFLASLVVTGLLTGGGHFPSPFEPSAIAFEFFSQHTAGARWQGFLQLGAAVPLGLFAATASRRLHFLGVRAAGVTIALFGGIGAAVVLALSAALQWTLGSPDVVASPAVVRALHLLAFATGGPGYVELLGILLAGLAVTAGLNRLLPRWMMGWGVVVAVLAELSWFSLVHPAARLLLPAARFPALAWLIMAAALLHDRRKGARESPLPSGATGATAAVRAVQETP